MILEQIQKIVNELEYSELPDCGDFEDTMSAYIYTTYPGDYIISASFNPLTGYIIIDFTFTNEDERLLFALRHGI